MATGSSSFWGSEPEQVNSSSVERIEKALKDKVQTTVSVDDPSKAIAIIFKKFDKNNSGKISLDEFLQGMKSLNFEGYEKDCTGLFKRFDTARAGYLDLKDFGAALFTTGDKKLRATSTIGKIREALTIRAGGYLELKDLSRQFKIMDKDGNGVLSREELKDGLAKFLRVFNYELKPAEFERLFAAFDLDGNGTLSHKEFIRGVRGEMSDQRRAIVKMAFEVLDTDKSGSISMEEIRAKYNVNKHPKVVSGQMTPEQAIKEFMSPWNKSDKDQITWEDFLDYYEYISPLIDNDDYFELMMRNAFHISGGEGLAANTSNKRVRVVHRDGKESIEEVKNDMGINKFDREKIMENLKAQGLDPVEIHFVN